MKADKPLYVVFSIPKKMYKNSNVATNRMVAAMQSDRLRTWAHDIWLQAVKDQFGLVQIQPDPSEWALPDEGPAHVNPANEEAVNEQENVIEALTTSIEDLVEEGEPLKENAAWRRRNPDSITAIQYREWKVKLDEAKAQYKAETKILRTLKSAGAKDLKKAATKRKSLEKRRHREATKAANVSNLLFPNGAVLKIRSNNVTNHDFDAPNSWPSVKPIQDGGTDTGLIWPDDSNSYIMKTEFWGGGRASKTEYVIEMLVCPLPEEPLTDPFGPLYGIAGEGRDDDPRILRE